MPTLSFEIRGETDSQIDLYDENERTLTRWFCDADDIRHFIGLVKEELGDESYVLENYF